MRTELAPSGAGRPVGALCGVLAAATTLGVAELVAVLVRPQASPGLAVGGIAVDATPQPVAERVIAIIGGTAGRLAVVVGFLLAVGLLGAALGIVALRRPALGYLGIGLLGLAAAAAALSRPGAEPPDAVPSVLGGIAGALALPLLLRTLGRSAPPSAVEKGVGEDGRTSRSGGRATPVDAEPVDPEPTGARSGGAGSGGAEPRERAPRQIPGMLPDGLARTNRKGAGFERRGLLLTGLATGTVGAASAGTGRALVERRFDMATSRSAVSLPRPASRAVPLPEGYRLGVEGVTRFFTANEDFFRIDTALVLPQVKPEDWRLRVHGMVDREIEIDFGQLLARPQIERDVTLACVSNPVGGELDGTARWLGARLRDVLEEAGVHPGATQLVSRSVDGMSIGTPTEVVMDGRDGMLAVAMNGEPLPPEHGFPVRMIVPGLFGYVSACKWITEIELTTFEAFDPYWVERGWDRRAPVKTFSRIDTPRSYGRRPAGRVVVAGIAYATESGIDAVEVRVDGGAWDGARLSTEVSVETWRQWIWDWDAEPGSHLLEVRATNGEGETQPEARTPTFPGGATGWHSVRVEIT